MRQPPHHRFRSLAETGHAPSLLVLMLTPALFAAPLSDYRSGESRAALAQIESQIRASATNRELRVAVESELASVLTSSTNGEARLFAAQQLAIIGTPLSLGALDGLLASPADAHLACLVLADHPSPKAGVLLRRMLPHAGGAARVQILNALARRAEPEAVPIIAPFATDPDAATADAARMALARTPGRAARAALARAPLLPEAELLRAERERDVPALAKLTQPGSPDAVRRGAWNLLADVDPGGAEKRVVDVLRGADALLKPVALARAGSLPGAQVSKRLAELLPALSNPERGWLIAALADRGDAPAREAVRGELLAGDPAVRLAAVAALQRLRDPAAAPALVLALDTAGETLSRAIERALADLPAGLPVDADLLVGMNRAPAPVQVRLIELLARRRATTAVPALLDSAAGTNALVAKAAWQAVGVLAGVDNLPAVLGAVGRHDAAEPAASRLLTRVEDPARRTQQVREALAQAAAPATRAALVRLLAKCGTPEALQTLSIAQADDDETVRDAAARTLAGWPGDAAWAPLLALYRQGASSTHRALALRGLARLAGEWKPPAGESMRPRYEPLLAGARSEEDRKLVLGAIAATGRAELIPLLVPFLNQPAVQVEAEAARAALSRPGPAARALFDGQTLQGWEGDTAATWRVEGGAITAGALDRDQPDNQYLATTREYGDFDLQLLYRLEGTAGFVNGGIQFRSVRLTDKRGMAGYQADLGMGHDGALYDEHRRDRFLARPTDAVRDGALVRGGWNLYRIRAEGLRVRIWLNGTLTVDYTEPDPKIPRRGVIAVQIHGNARSRVSYRGLFLEELN